MKHALNCIILGCQNLPGLGSHPGTFVFLAMVVLGYFAGGIVGSVILLVCFIPLYLTGAYFRGEIYLLNKKWKGWDQGGAP
jgi:hypothetical protein